jgi:hypothetical protein
MPWDEYSDKVFVSYSRKDVLPDDPGKTWDNWLEIILKPIAIACG